MIGILGTGSSLPNGCMTNDDFVKIIDTTDEWITTRTGIRSRHIANQETALELCVDAAQKALSSANTKPEELSLIIVATITPDTATPSLSCSVMKAIGARCPAFDLNAACSGFLYGVIAAKHMEQTKKTLVIGSELLSRVTDYTDRGTCILFGDGVGAAVLGPTDGPGEIVAHRYMSYPDDKNVLKIPGLNRGDPERDNKSLLFMDGREVYKFATRVFVEEIQALLDGAGLTPEDVAWFVPHQANIRIIETAAKKLKLPMERFFVNIQHTGNTSSASVPIALDELIRAGKVQRGDLLVLGAFGGGLTSATIAFRA